MRGYLPGLVLSLMCGCATGSTTDADGGGSPSGSSSSASGVSGSAGNGPFGNADGPPELAVGADLDSEPRGCNDLRVEFAPIIPTVLLVVDRSGSMFDMPYGAHPTRWQALDEALFPGSGGVIASFQDSVRFGLMTYTADSAGGTCPILRDVAPSLGNHAALDSLYLEESTRPGYKAETPTGAALEAAIGLLQSSVDDGVAHILLVTDGEPDDCVTADPQCGQDQSIAAVQRARSLGIGTSVVGISADVSAQHLQDLANAGQGLPVQAPDMQYTYNCVNPGYATLSASYAAAGEAPGSAPIFQPADATGLASAFETLIRGVTGCSFELQGEVDLEQAHLGAVVLDGAPLSYEHADGWRMESSRVLEVQGSACEQILTESRELVISFPCDVVELL